jgi:hypothetical protein
VTEAAGRPRVDLTPVNKNEALIELSERLSKASRGTPFRRRSEPHRVFTAVFDAISRASQEVRAEWGRLDHEFITYPENLTELLFDFVRRHPKEFGALE